VSRGGRIQYDAIVSAPPHQIDHLGQRHDLVGTRGEGIEHLPQIAEGVGQISRGSASVVVSADQVVDETLELSERLSGIDLHGDERSIGGRDSDQGDVD